MPKVLHEDNLAKQMIAVRNTHESALTRYQKMLARAENVGEIQPRLLPVLERTDITFKNLDEKRIQVGVTVHNRRDRPTMATLMTIAAAPLGAFVPWQPLGIFAVPALLPGHSQAIRTVVDYMRPRTLGRPSRVTPGSLQTAVFQNPQKPSRRAMLSRLFHIRRFMDGAPASRLGLPADPLHALGQGSVYWAGNLNVFIGPTSVERHRASALRVYPGRENRALFFVGEGYDAYSFQLDGDADGWYPELMNLSDRGHLAVEEGEAGPIRESDWYVTHSQLLVGLTMHPPADCAEGTIAVHVTQQSTKKTVMVEFDLSPWAQGAGCYTV